MHLLNGWPALHWAWAGAAIGGITLTLLFVAHRRLGVSGGFDDVCSMASRLPYFSGDRTQKSWRITFLAGLVVGGALSVITGTGWEPTWALGVHDAAFGMGPLGKTAWMFGGGLAIGFGTRLAGGCTSGHGIFGIANFERASWVATITFMAVGIVVTHLIYRVLGA